MVRTEHVLINKKHPFSFKVGQKFVVKIAKNVVAKLTVTERKTLRGLPIIKYEDAYEVRDLHGVPSLFKVFYPLYGKAIYEVVETKEEPTVVVSDIETLYPNLHQALVKEPVFGVVKTKIEEKGWYIVWSPGSTQPSQQIFVSARQARFVAYRMSEEHKGQIFYWAKLEGHAQWGQLPDEQN